MPHSAGGGAPLVAGLWPGLVTAMHEGPTCVRSGWPTPPGGTGGQRRERYPRNPTHCSIKKVLLKVLMAARTWGKGWSGRSRNLGEGMGGEAALGTWEERPRGSCSCTAHPRRGGYACPPPPRGCLAGLWAPLARLWTSDPFPKTELLPSGVGLVPLCRPHTQPHRQTLIQPELDDE